MSARFLFLDLETTGLEAGVDQITEAAFILGGSEFQLFVEHTRLPGEWVLKNTDYLSRIALAPKDHFEVVASVLDRICSRGSQPYLVGACPAFDDRFLRVEYAKLGRPVPYHYHVIDVEAMAMGKLGHDEPCRLKDLRAALGISGENEAAHTALADAREAKLIFDALRAPA